MATEIGRLVAVIDGDISGLQRAIAGAQKTLQSAGASMTKAGQSLTMGLTLPIVAIGGIAAKASIDFESAFAGVRKTVEATAEELDKLRTGIRGMAKEMPESAVGIARVAEAAGQLGIKTENILEFTRVMVMLGETTNLSADEAATAMARLANIMQTPQDQFEKLGATLVDLGNKGASTEAEIVEMALRIAGAGKQIGLTEAEVLAFANALSSVGIEAQMGGSAISRAFIEIANAVADGGDDLEAFAVVAGMAAQDFAKAFRDDPAQAMISFITGLDRMAQEGHNVFGILDDLELGEIRVRDALLRAAGAGDLFNQSLKDGEQAWTNGSALATEYGKRVETTAARLEIFKNRLMDSAITLGDALVPALMDVLEASEPVIKAIEFMATGFANLPKPVQMVIVGIAALLAVIGPLLIIMGAMATGVSALIAVLAVFGIGTTAATVGTTGLAVSFGALTLAALPWLVLAAAIVAGLYLLIKNWDAVSAAIMHAADVVQNVLIGAFNAVLGFLRSHWPEVVTIISGPFGPLVALATDAFGLRSALVKAFTEIISFLGSVPTFIARAFSGMDNLLYNAGIQLMRGLINGIADGAKVVFDYIGKIASQISGFFNKALGIRSPSTVMRRIGSQTMQGFGQGLESGWKSYVDPIVHKYIEQFLASGIVPALSESDAANIAATQALLQLDPSAYGDPSKVQGFANTIKALVAALGLIPKASGGAASGFSNVEEQIAAAQAAFDAWAKTEHALKPGIMEDYTENLAETIKKLRSGMKGIVAEDFSLVPGDFYGGGSGSTFSLGGKAGSSMFRAEDGSMVPPSFYGEAEDSAIDLGGAIGKIGPITSKSFDEAAKATKKLSDAMDEAATPKLPSLPKLPKAEKVDEPKFDWMADAKSQLEAALPVQDAFTENMEEITPPTMAAGDAVEGLGKKVDTSTQPVQEFAGAWESTKSTLGNMGDFFSGVASDFDSSKDKIRDSVLSSIGGIASAFDASKDRIRDSVLSSIGGAFSSLGGAIGGAFEATKTEVGASIAHLISFIGENFTAEKLGRAMAWILLGPAFLFKAGFEAVLPTLSTFFGTTLPAFFLETLPALQQSLQELGVQAVNGLAAGLSTFFTSTLPGFLASIYTQGQNIGRLLIEGIARGLTDAWQTVTVFFLETLPNAFLTIGPPIYEAAQSLGKQIIEGIGRGLTDAWKTITSFFTVTIPKFITEIIPSVHKTAMGIGKSIVEGIVSGLTAAGAWLLQQAGNFVNGFVDEIDKRLGIGFGNAANWLVVAGANLVVGLWNGIAARAEWLYGMVLNFAKGIYNKVKEGLGSLWPGSPSEAGVDIAIGFGLGLMAGLPAALKNASHFADAISSAIDVKSLVSDAQGAFNNGMTMTSLSAPRMPHIPWQDLGYQTDTPERRDGLTIQAYDTVVNNYDEMQDVDKAIADIAFAAAAELRARGR